MNSKPLILEKIKEIIILIRIQQLGTSITGVIGALTIKGVNLELSNLILLFLMGVLINICGQVHNDIRDLEIDKYSKELNPRPLVKGTVKIRTAWIISLSSLILVFIIAFIFFRNIFTISVLIISIIFGYLYNVYSKRIPGADAFLSVTMACFCLFGALAMSRNIQSLGKIGPLTWIIVGIVFVHVFIMDSMGGGLKDVKNDREAGANTLAVYLGVQANKKFNIPLSFKLINLSFDVTTVILVTLPFIFLDFRYYLVQIPLLTFFILVMLYSSIRLLNMKIFDRKKIKFHNRNHELASYVLVPILLLNLIGISYALFLMFFPFLWFITFNYIFYRDRWTSPKTF